MQIDSYVVVSVGVGNSICLIRSVIYVVVVEYTLVLTISVSRKHRKGKTEENNTLEGEIGLTESLRKSSAIGR